MYNLYKLDWDMQKRKNTPCHDTEVSPFELGAQSDYQDEQLDNSCVTEWGAERIYLSDDFKVQDLAILLNDPDENFQPHQGQDLFLEALFIRES